MSNTRRSLMLVVAVVAVSSTALASLPTPPTPTAKRGTTLDMRKRFVDPKSCCEADPDMCRQQTPRPTLTRAQALTVIQREGDTARACLSATTPTAKVRFEVDAAGTPRRVAVVDEVPADVAACLAGAVAAWRFPATARGLDVPLSFRFARRTR